MYIIRLSSTAQYVRIDPAGKARFVPHMSDATRMEADQAARVLAALPHSLGARRREVRR